MSAVIADELVGVEVTENLVEFDHFQQKNIIAQTVLFIIMLNSVIDQAKDLWKKHKYKILAGVSFAFAGYFFLKYMENGGSTKWSSFIQAVRQGKVKQIIVDGDIVFFRSESSQWFKSYMSVFSQPNIWDLVKDTDIVFSEKQALVPRQLYQVGLACLTSYLSFKFLTNSMNVKKVKPLDLKSQIAQNQTLLEDYYGGQEIKYAFRETIDLLQNPEKYQQMGARIRRGILFYGPPGTGKTMLARALAAEAGCHFIRVAASEFRQLYVGVGPKRIRQLFREARSYKQGCIIFIDQIDALGSRANELRDNHQTTSTINQFLNQIDGFTPNEKVVVVAATNRLDLVDNAVLRSGRFDMKIHIPLPDQNQRKGILWKILDKKLKNLHNVKEDMVSYIGSQTRNWCGADLQALVNESIYKAIAVNSQIVENQHLLDAFHQVNQLR